MWFVWSTESSVAWQRQEGPAVTLLQTPVVKESATAEEALSSLLSWAACSAWSGKLCHQGWKLYYHSPLLTTCKSRGHARNELPFSSFWNLNSWQERDFPVSCWDSKTVLKIVLRTVSCIGQTEFKICILKLIEGYKLPLSMNMTMNGMSVCGQYVEMVTYPKSIPCLRPVGTGYPYTNRQQTTNRLTWIH